MTEKQPLSISSLGWVITPIRRLSGSPKYDRISRAPRPTAFALDTQAKTRIEKIRDSAEVLLPFAAAGNELVLCTGDRELRRIH